MEDPNAEIGALSAMLDMITEFEDLWDANDRENVARELLRASVDARARMQALNPRAWARCQGKVRFQAKLSACAGDPRDEAALLDRVIDGRMAVIEFVLGATGDLFDGSPLFAGLAKKQADLIELRECLNVAPPDADPRG